MTEEKAPLLLNISMNFITFHAYVICEMNHGTDISVSFSGREKLIATFIVCWSSSHSFYKLLIVFNFRLFDGNFVSIAVALLYYFLASLHCSSILEIVFYFLNKLSILQREVLGEFFRYALCKREIVACHKFLSTSSARSTLFNYLLFLRVATDEHTHTHTYARTRLKSR